MSIPPTITVRCSLFAIRFLFPLPRPPHQSDPVMQKKKAGGRRPLAVREKR
jgi:hypothetical protein